MLKFKNTLPFLVVFFFAGCASVTHYSQQHSIPVDGYITVLPFQNNTNTPLAGQKAKNILAGILFAKNYPVTIASLNEEYLTEDQLRKIVKRVPTKYYLYGSVNEWRYKTGIEAEPAVAVNFRIVDKTSGAIVYSAVGAKNGWGQESAGSVAQKLMLELINR